MRRPSKDKDIQGLLVVAASMNHLQQLLYRESFIGVWACWCICGFVCECMHGTRSPVCSECMVWCGVDGCWVFNIKVFATHDE